MWVTILLWYILEEYDITLDESGAKVNETVKVVKPQPEKQQKKQLPKAARIKGKDGPFETDKLPKAVVVNSFASEFQTVVNTIVYFISKYNTISQFLSSDFFAFRHQTFTVYFNVFVDFEIFIFKDPLKATSSTV